MKYYLSALLALSLLSACSSSNNNPFFQTQGKPDVQAATTSDHTFNAIGYAPIDGQPGSSFEVKMLNAIKASKLEAYKEMAEQIYGVLLSAENNVEDATLTHDKIKSQVKGLVKGARVLKSYHEGEFYITEIELDMQTLAFLNEAVFNEQGVTVRKVQESVYY